MKTKLKRRIAKELDAYNRRMQFHDAAKLDQLLSAVAEVARAEALMDASEKLLDDANVSSDPLTLERAAHRLRTLK